MSHDAMGQLLFEAAGWRVRELDAHEVPQVQALFDANPEYFEAINGRRPHADEAQTEFDEMPPAALGYTRRWFAGAFDASEALAGLVVVVSDLCAPRVWHVALFMVSTPLRGTGAASALYRGLERWMSDAGAQWLRLCVVAGNTVAERFWARLGYEPVCSRPNVDTGGRLNTVHVLVKRLQGQPLADYLALVPRDRATAEST